MGKTLILLTSVILTYFIDYIYTGDVNLYANFQSEVEAGKDFDVEITVEKGNLSEFGKFTQSLPEGFYAYSTHPYFKFKDQRVIFSWILLPNSNAFTFNYTIHVPADYIGEFQLTGQFAYVMDNEKRFVELKAQPIEAKPTGSEIHSEITKSSNGIDNIPNKNDILCYRQITKQNNEYYVKIQLCKEQLNDMAKIVENIPAGYTAKEISSSEGIFTATDECVKFLWMNIPQDNKIIVEYKLIPNNKYLGQPSIDGSFSYSINNLTYTVSIIDKDFDTSTLTNDIASSEQESKNNKNDFSDDDYNLLFGLNETIETNNRETLADVKEAEQTQQATSNANADAIAIEDNTQNTNIDTQTSTNTQTEETNTNYNIADNNTSNRYGTVNFKIQIAAGHKLVNTQKHFKKFGIQEKVYVTQHDGWHKYTIQDFTEYVDARNYRDKINSTTKIKDAFIVAYSNGVRITVQEALMISNQQWFK